MSNPNELSEQKISEWKSHFKSEAQTGDISIEHWHELRALCDLALRALQDQKHSGHLISPTSQDNPSSGEDVETLIRELDALEAKATPGPYYLGNDEADDCADHTASGLALIDTGRHSDFYISRLMEWNNAAFIAKLLNAYRKLRDAAMNSGQSQNVGGIE